MVTPVTAAGELDEPAVDRLVDSFLDAEVEGIFVLGTTGEATSVPRAFRRRLVERAHARTRRRCHIFAGLGDVRPNDFPAANEYLRAGAIAVVVHPPISTPVPLHELGDWYRALLAQLEGALILYNMPVTTGVSIPLDTIAQLASHPKVAGIKDSENNRQRHIQLLERFGHRPDFSVFIGVGALMEQGLKLGADGIVPSVGNLIPEVCHNLCMSAKRGDWTEAGIHFARMNEVAGLYQRGRNLGESLAALKAALYHRGICAPNVLPPLHPLSPAESASLRSQMSQLHLLK